MRSHEMHFILNFYMVFTYKQCPDILYMWQFNCTSFQSRYDASFARFATLGLWLQDKTYEKYINNWKVIETRQAETIKHFSYIFTLNSPCPKTNPFTPSRLFYDNTFDRSIPSRRSAWLIFIITMVLFVLGFYNQV